MEVDVNNTLVSFLSVYLCSDSSQQHTRSCRLRRGEERRGEESSLWWEWQPVGGHVMITLTLTLTLRRAPALVSIFSAWKHLIPTWSYNNDIKTWQLNLADSLREKDLQNWGNHFSWSFLITRCCLAWHLHPWLKLAWWKLALRTCPSWCGKLLKTCETSEIMEQKLSKLTDTLDKMASSLEGQAELITEATIADVTTYGS